MKAVLKNILVQKISQQHKKETILLTQFVDQRFPCKKKVR